MDTTQENDLLSEITDLILATDLNDTERSALVSAKSALEKKEYFPKIVSDIKSELTPLAMQNKLSKSISPFYLKITNKSFINKYQGLGYGLGVNFGSH